MILEEEKRPYCSSSSSGSLFSPQPCSSDSNGNQSEECKHLSQCLDKRNVMAYSVKSEPKLIKEEEKYQVGSNSRKKLRSDKSEPNIIKVSSIEA
jgi:hypothetical protein